MGGHFSDFQAEPYSCCWAEQHQCQQTQEALACLSLGAPCWFLRGVGRDLQRPGSFSVFCSLWSDKTRPQPSREQIVRDLQGVASLRELAHERLELLTWDGEVGTIVPSLQQVGGWAEVGIPGPTNGAQPLVHFHPWPLVPAGKSLRP